MLALGHFRQYECSSGIGDRELMRQNRTRLWVKEQLTLTKNSAHGISDEADERRVIRIALDVGWKSCDWS